MSVVSNLEIVRNNIEKACKRSNRNLEDITIIAVTKYVTIERTQEAIEAGINHLGENRTDEFVKKQTQINNDDVNWHFIGTLQSRKVREVVDKVTAIHSLDRKSLAKEINKRTSKPVECFIQVNVSGEDTKHGLHPEEVLNFIREIDQYENIQVIGLMTMAPHVEDEQVLREVFRKLADLRDQVKEKHLAHAPCKYLSMGMSNDYEIAIEEGATHIRIGSELVGPYDK